HLDGNALGMTLNASGSTLYVAQDNADQVAVIDTASNTVVGKIDARAPNGVLSGNGDDDNDDQGDDDNHGNGNGKRAHFTGGATLRAPRSPDGRTLYAVTSGATSIAVIPLRGARPKVAGLTPTAYEPHDITFSRDGRAMYIINGKSVTGPNPGHLSSN